VNLRSAPWARAFTSTARAKNTIQASACRQLPSPRFTKKNVFEAWARGVNIHCLECWTWR